MIANVTQWAIVAVIVAVCAAYALKALLPRAARRGLAAWFARRGWSSIAVRLDAGSSGCDACGGAASRVVRGPAGPPRVTTSAPRRRGDQ